MIRFPFVIASLALSTAAMAQTNAAGSISYVQNGANYTYDITLRNTGTTNVGTLWYAWIPGQDYLPVAPTSTSGPANWVFTQTTSPGFGFGLRWVAPAGGAIAPGGILDGFTFTTTTTPGELAGNSVFGSHPPLGTTFIYEGAPFVGGVRQIVINPTPEPASFAALAGALVMVGRRKRRR